MAGELVEVDGHVRRELHIHEVTVFVAAFFGGFIATRLHLPPIVGYLLAGIVIGLPSGIQQIASRVSAGDPMQTLGVVFLIVVMIALIALIVYVESARRNIAISYASRRVGSQTFRGQETSLPLKSNMGGVILRGYVIKEN